MCYCGFSVSLYIHNKQCLKIGALNLCLWLVSPWFFFSKTTSELKIHVHKEGLKGAIRRLTLRVNLCIHAPSTMYLNVSSLTNHQNYAKLFWNVLWMNLFHYHNMVLNRTLVCHDTKKKLINFLVKNNVLR